MNLSGDDQKSLKDFIRKKILNKTPSKIPDDYTKLGLEQDHEFRKLQLAHDLKKEFLIVKSNMIIKGILITFISLILITIILVLATVMCLHEESISSIIPTIGTIASGIGGGFLIDHAHKSKNKKNKN